MWQRLKHGHKGTQNSLAPDKLNSAFLIRNFFLSIEPRKPSQIGENGKDRSLV